jgi:hypothetical protein
MDTAQPAFALVSALVRPRSVRLTAACRLCPRYGGRRVKRLVNGPEEATSASADTAAR